MKLSPRSRAPFAAALLALAACTSAFAHGDVVPQAVDTKSLPALGEAWRDENPFRNHEAAIKVCAAGCKDGT